MLTSSQTTSPEDICVTDNDSSSADVSNQRNTDCHSKTAHNKLCLTSAEGKKGKKNGCSGNKHTCHFKRQHRIQIYWTQCTRCYLINGACVEMYNHCLSWHAASAWRKWCVQGFCTHSSLISFFFFLLNTFATLSTFFTRSQFVVEVWIGKWEKPRERQQQHAFIFPEDNPKLTSLLLSNENCPTSVFRWCAQTVKSEIIRFLEKATSLLRRDVSS